MHPIISSVFALALFLGCFPVMCFSQHIEVTASKHEVNKSTTSLHKIIGHDNENFYVIKHHSSQFYLEKLDGNLNLMLEQPIKLFEGLKTYDLETVVDFYDELYIFVSRKRIHDVTLYYQRINKGSLLPSTELITLANIPCVKGAWADFHFSLSRHQKRLLVACKIKLQWSNVQFNEYYVFGENMELIWKRKDSFSFKGQGPRENKYIVDEIGNLSILSLQKRESLMSLIRENKNLYTIYRCTNDGTDFQEYAVTLKERYIRGINIIGGENGELICAGLYSEFYRPGIRGTFLFKIYPNAGGIQDIRLDEFDDAFMARLAAMKEPTLNDEELIKYVMTDLVLQDNGKITCIAEQFFDQPYRTYNNLIVTCYDSNGGFQWNQVIDKIQDYNFSNITIPDLEMEDYRDYVMQTGLLNPNIKNYCSYALMAPLDRSGIILFFNDHIRNLEGSDKKRSYGNPKKSYLQSVMIDEYGNVSRKELLRWKKKETYPEPMRYYDTLYSTLVIPAFRDRKYNYLKITAAF